MRSFFLGLLVFACVPLGVEAQPTGGQPVGFSSKDFGGKPVPLRAMLYRSNGPEKGSVVLVHGSGGWSDAREGHYARALSGAGFTVLAIDAFGPRQISNTTEDQTKLTMSQMTLDALSARRYLVEQGASADRMAVMGFSKGGVVAMYNADRTMLSSEIDRFPVAIPFYPGCSNRPRVPKPASIVFMALGEKDDYTGVKPCQELAEDYSKAGGNIKVKVYPNSSHAFDGDPAHTGMYRARFVENYMDCVVYVEADGTQSYGGKSYPAGDPAIYDALRGTCMKKGASLWTNTTQKANATADVIEFLNDVFKLK